MTVTESASSTAAIGSVELETSRRRRRFRLSLIGLVVLLFFAATVGLSLGAVSVPFSDVWSTVWSHLTQRDTDGGTYDIIIWQIRAPRVALGIIVGSALALIGLVVQALVRNPLADPYVLGVESGAAAAAVAVIFLSRRAVLSGEWSPTVAAFLGALATLALVFSIARKNGRVTSTRVLLVGVALSYALSGLTSFFLYASPDPAAQAQVLFWIMGGLGGASWTNLPIALGVLVAAWLAFGYYARQLNAMAMGDMSAVAVGLNPDRVRTRLLIISSLLVAVTVTLAGPIGFVGLVVPHVGRMLFGAEHRRLIPAVVLLGGIYLVLVDTLCRTIFAPSEIPIGVMTALLGTPFFLWLIRRKDSAMGGA